MSAEHSQKVEPPKSTGPKKESFKGFLSRVPLDVKIKLGAIAFLGLITVIVGIWGAVKVLTYKPKPPEPPPEHAHGEHERESGPAAAYRIRYEVQDVSVHFSSHESNQTSYAQFSMAFDMPDHEAFEAMQLNRAKILDVVFETASDMPLEIVRSPNGVTEFKKRLLEKYQEVFSEKAPREIAIRNWVVY